MDIIQIADALVLQLSGGSFIQPFIPARAIFPNFEIKELNTLKVTVVPRSVESLAISRGSYQDDYIIDIGVQKKLTEDFEAETVSLIGLVTEIKNSLWRSILRVGSVSAIGVNTKVDPIYSREHLAADNVFTSIVSVTYRAIE